MSTVAYTGTLRTPLRSTGPAILLLALVGLAGCRPRERGTDPDELRGMVLTSPIRKPDFTLDDTDGRPFDFRKRTAGKLALLFFGYTNCPDVCPLHMANIATVLRDMPYDVVSRTTVVFVTVDPKRDTPRHLREWLDHFDPRFVGLRGSDEEVSRVEGALGIATAVADTADTDGNYGVGHAAQVIAFTPDGLAHVLYPFGTRQEDWAHDLPALLSGPWAADTAGTAR